MRIRINDPELLPDLVTELTARVDVIATRVGPCDVEVSLLGSRTAPYHRRELERRLEQWRLQNPHGRVEVLPE
jgi:hypothetical protein